MLGVQTDVYSAFSQYLAKSIVAAYDRRKAHNPDLEDAIALLRGWNGQMDKDQAAPLVVTLAYQHLRRAVAESASPRHGAAYELQMAPAVLETLLRTRPAGWFPDYDLLLLRVLADGVDEGRRIQGSQRPEVEIRRLSAPDHRASGGPSFAAGGQVFRYRTDAHERKSRPP